MKTRQHFCNVTGAQDALNVTKLQSLFSPRLKNVAVSRYNFQHFILASRIVQVSHSCLLLSACDATSLGDSPPHGPGRNSIVQGSFIHIMMHFKRLGNTLRKDGGIGKLFFSAVRISPLRCADALT